MASTANLLNVGAINLIIFDLVNLRNITDQLCIIKKIENISLYFLSRKKLLNQLKFIHYFDDVIL